MVTLYLLSFTSDIGSDIKLVNDMALAADALRECVMCEKRFDPGGPGRFAPTAAAEVAMRFPFGFDCKS